MLRQAFSEAGFAQVKTYIQSGNILFNSSISDPEQVTQKIEDLIQCNFGFHTDVILRKTSEVKEIVISPLFYEIKSDNSKKYYITFLKQKFSEKIDLPLFSKNKDVEIFYSNGMHIYSISSEYNGKFGFPNAFIEKLTGIPATTRNPNTLEKLLTI